MWIQDFDGDRYRVGDAFDSDGDLTIAGSDYPRAEVAKLRDHLNTLLGDAPAAPDVAQAARTVAGKAEQEHDYVTARWFREFADLLEGKSL